MPLGTATPADYDPPHGCGRYLLAIALMATGVATAQDDRAFQIGVNTIPVDTLVTLNQRPLRGLNLSDFELRENGQPVTIRSLSTEDLPLDIVVVYPESFSTYPFRPTSGVVAEIARRAQNGAANILRRTGTQDRVAFVTYGRNPEIVQDFTTDRERIAAAIRKVGAKHGSSSGRDSEYWSFEYAIRMLSSLNASPRERRRVILKIVDPLPGAYSDAPIIRRLWQEHIVLSTLTIFAPSPSAPLNPLPEDPTRREPLDADFRQGNPLHIAQATGGDGLFFAIDPEYPADLLTPLRQRYILWFDQPADLPPGAQRTIGVALTPAARKRFANASLQYRTGYVTGRR